MLAVEPESLSQFEAICERERCPYAVVGEATDAQHLSVNDRDFGNAPVDLPMSVLFGKPPKMHRHARRYPAVADDFNASAVSVSESLERVLTFPAVGSKSFLITIGDRSVTGTVARDQMVGPWQVPVADAAVTVTGFQGTTGEAMAMGERPSVALLDAAASGRHAVTESLTNLVSSDFDLDRVVMSANWMCAASHP